MNFYIKGNRFYAECEYECGDIEITITETVKLENCENLCGNDCDAIYFITDGEVVIKNVNDAMYDYVVRNGEIIECEAEDGKLNIIAKFPKLYEYRDETMRNCEKHAAKTQLKCC